MNWTLCLAALLSITTLPALADPCAKAAQRNTQLDTGGITKIAITAGAGELQIKGERGRKQLDARGEACASNQGLLDKIQLESRREGSTLIVKAVLPETDRFLGYARLDLTIAVPDDIDLSVQDSSGDATIQNVRGLALNDSSGDLDVRNVGGDMTVNDSSGDIEIERVAGKLVLSDSSGDIVIAQVEGEVEIETDSSGDIRIAKAKAVHIMNDSSGEISIAQIDGDVLIDNDSSGDITVSDVAGKFTVSNDASGSIRNERVAGAVNLPSR